jgi:hypothetical protein
VFEVEHDAAFPFTNHFFDELSKCVTIQIVRFAVNLNHDWISVGTDEEGGLLSFAHTLDRCGRQEKGSMLKKIEEDIVTDLLQGVTMWFINQLQLRINREKERVRKGPRSLFHSLNA